MFNVTKFDTLDVDKIKISVGDNCYNIFLRYDKKDLVIQSPIMIAPFGISQFGQNKYIDLSFVNIDNDASIKNFHDKISFINQLILKHMRYKEKYFKKDFINSIKKSDGIYPKRMRLSLDKESKIYNSYNKQSDIDIKPRALLKTLIHLSHVWVNNGKFGIFWNIVQMKHYGKLILTEYEFLEDETPQFLKIPDINKSVIKRDFIPPPPPPLPNLNKVKYMRYFKMIEMGVDSNAVKQKLVMDGHDPNIIDNPSCDIVCPKNQDEKKKDELAMSQKVNLLSELTSGIKLKNVKKVTKPKLKKTLKNNNENLTVPSLWEVRNCLKNLKKTNINLLK